MVHCVYITHKHRLYKITDRHRPDPQDQNDTMTELDPLMDTTHVQLCGPHQ